MELKKKIVLREIAGETLLIPVEDTAGEYNGIFNLSPSAALIFKDIRDGKEEPEIIKDLCENFEVEEAQAAADTKEFLDSLRNYGII